MDSVAPVGPVYQAGTLSGNPLAVAAGLETLRIIEEDSGSTLDWNEPAQKWPAARAALRNRPASEYGSTRSARCSRSSSPAESLRYTVAKAADTNQFARYFHAMLGSGIYLPLLPVRNGFHLCRNDQR